MSASRSDRVDALLEVLSELPRERREARARELCADQPDLLDELLSLLPHLDDDFLRTPSSPPLERWVENSLASAARGLTDGAESQVLKRLDEVQDVLSELSASLVPGTAPSAPEPDLPLGYWGDLQLLEPLGQGGFGDVYLAWDMRLQRKVALKLLRVDTSAGEKSLDEGRKLARIHHQNVVEVYGAQVHEGLAGISMEYVDGETLSALLRRQGRFSERETLLIGADLCNALTALHTADLVHGDVKAQNVMRREGGGIVLMDFGAAVESTGRRPGVTAIGTALYMAPELFDGGPRTSRSDAYSLGVLLFHLVTGAYPVPGGSLAEVRESHRRGRAELLDDLRPELGRPFVRAVERALRAEPSERFGSAGDFKRALEEALSGAVDMHGERARARASRRRWVRRAAVVMLALAGLGLGTWGATVWWSTFDIEAGLYVLEDDGTARRMEPGEELEPVTAYELRLRPSRDVYVYVLNWVDGETPLLQFPLEHLDLKNPLSGGREHRIPGHSRKGSRSWTTPWEGGREVLLMIAGRKPLSTIAGLVETARAYGNLQDSAPALLDGQSLYPLGRELRIYDEGTDAAVESPLHLYETVARMGSEVEIARSLWVVSETVRTRAEAVIDDDSTVVLEEFSGSLDVDFPDENGSDYPPGRELCWGGAETDIRPCWRAGRSSMGDHGGGPPHVGIAGGRATLTGGRGSFSDPLLFELPLGKALDRWYLEVRFLPQSYVGRGAYGTLAVRSVIPNARSGFSFDVTRSRICLNWLTDEDRHCRRLEPLSSNRPHVARIWNLPSRVLALVTELNEDGNELRVGEIESHQPVTVERLVWRVGNGAAVPVVLDSVRVSSAGLGLTGPGLSKTSAKVSEFRVTRALPVERVRLYRGRQRGRMPVDGCPALEVGLADPVLLGESRASQIGGVSFFARLHNKPIEVPDGVVHLQAVALDTCRISSVVTHSIGRPFTE